MPTTTSARCVWVVKEGGQGEPSLSLELHEGLSNLPALDKGLFMLRFEAGTGMREAEEIARLLNGRARRVSFTSF